MAGLRILYTNADSLLNKLDLLDKRIATTLPEVVCINEVKPKRTRYEPYAAEFSPLRPGYSFFDNNVGPSSSGRGQVIYAKSDINAKRIYLDSRFEEYMLLEVPYARTKKLLIALIYRSGSGSSLK